MSMLKINAFFITFSTCLMNLCLHQNNYHLSRIWIRKINEQVRFRERKKESRLKSYISNTFKLYVQFSKPIYTKGDTIRILMNSLIQGILKFLKYIEHPLQGLSINGYSSLHNRVLSITLLHTRKMSNAFSWNLDRIHFNIEFFWSISNIHFKFYQSMVTKVYIIKFR
jgi:hypothetical protein